NLPAHDASVGLVPVWNSRFKQTKGRRSARIDYHSVQPVVPDSGFNLIVGIIIGQIACYRFYAVGMGIRKFLQFPFPARYGNNRSSFIQKLLGNGPAKAAAGTANEKLLILNF